MMPGTGDYEYWSATDHPADPRNDPDEEAPEVSSEYCGECYRHKRGLKMCKQCELAAELPDEEFFDYA